MSSAATSTDGPRPTKSGPLTLPPTPGRSESKAGEGDDEICTVRSAAGEARQGEGGRGFSAFCRTLGERLGGHDLVVRHSRGAILLRHLRYVRRRGWARCASQRKGGGGLNGKSQGRRPVC